MLLIALLEKSVLDLIYKCVKELTHCRCWNLTCIGEENLIYTSIKQLSWKLKVSEIPQILSSNRNWNNTLECLNLIVIYY